METPFSVHVTEQLAAKSKRVISQPQNRHRRRRQVDVDDVGQPTSTMSIWRMYGRVIRFHDEESHEAMTFPEKTYSREKSIQKGVNEFRLRP